MQVYSIEHLKEALNILDVDLMEHEINSLYKNKISLFTIIEETGKYLNAKNSDQFFKPVSYFLYLRDNNLSLFGYAINNAIIKVVRGVVKTSLGWFTYDTQHYLTNSVLPLKCLSGVEVEKALAYKRERYPDKKDLLKFSPDWSFQDKDLAIEVINEFRKNGVELNRLCCVTEKTEFTYPVGTQLLFTEINWKLKNFNYAVKFPEDYTAVKE